MHVTSKPNSEKQAPDTSPTYPVPITAIFTILSSLTPMGLTSLDNRQAKFVQSQSLTYAFYPMKILTTLTPVFRIRIFIDFVAVWLGQCNIGHITFTWL